MKQLISILALLVMVSCIDRNYDTSKGFDSEMNVLPGLKIDLGRAVEVKADSLFGLTACKSVRVDEDGLYAFVLPSLDIFGGSYISQQLREGVTDTRTHHISTHAELPEILDEKVSSFVLSGLAFDFLFDNASPYDLYVRVGVNVGGKDAVLSFMASALSDSRYNVSLDMPLTAVPRKLDITGVSVKMIDEPYYGPSGSESELFRLSMNAQPEVPLKFDEVEEMNCYINPQIIFGGLDYNTGKLEALYRVTNGTGMTIQVLFDYPASGNTQVSMDPFKALKGVQQSATLRASCPGNLRDSLSGVKVKLCVSSDSAAGASLVKDASLKLALSSVTFPDGLKWL